MRCNILVIEDDEAIRETLRMMLELEGYTVATAENGQEGLEKLPTMDTPCLILLDLMMPVMDGWSFAESLRADMTLATIPIVVVTAYSEKAGSLKTVQGVVKKPIDMNLLMPFVKRHCG